MPDKTLTFKAKCHAAFARATFKGHPKQKSYLAGIAALTAFVILAVTIPVVLLGKPLLGKLEGGHGKGGHDDKLVCPPDEALYDRPEAASLRQRLAPRNDNFCVKNPLTQHFGFSECCRLHEICYTGCGAEKRACDEAVVSCMQQTCSRSNGLERDFCDGITKATDKAFELLRELPFKDVQEQYCQCSKHPIERPSPIHPGRPEHHDPRYPRRHHF